MGDAVAATKGRLTPLCSCCRSGPYSCVKDTVFNGLSFFIATGQVPRHLEGTIVQGSVWGAQFQRIAKEGRALPDLLG